MSDHHRFEVRAAAATDRDGLLELASFLNTVNLPHDASAVGRILSESEQSFSHAIDDPALREYVFVLVDRQSTRVIGSSMVIGQLGRRSAPYLYFQVDKEERYSSTLDRHFKHRVLSMRYSYDGPTEIGGLVLHPDYRGRAERLGRLISYVRFLWIAMQRSEFQNCLLAELLPPLEPDGTSHLWEAVGRRFTGLDYREADRLSKENKEFIRGLFPKGDIYGTLLSPEARSVIGEVGQQTQGVEKMLRRIGFRYAQRVDPFDGGPHFTCPTDEVSLVRDARSGPVLLGEPQQAGSAGLLACALSAPPWFRALAASASLREDGALVVAARDAAELGLTPGAEAWWLPMPQN